MACNSLVTACGKGVWPLALRLRPLDAVGYGALISACGARWRMAMKVAEMAPRLTLEATNAALSACQTHWQSAVGLLSAWPLDAAPDDTSYGATISHSDEDS